MQAYFNQSREPSFCNAQRAAVALLSQSGRTRVVSQEIPLRHLRFCLALLLLLAMLTLALPARAQNQGIWISGAELMSRPTSGPAWANLLARADSPCGTPNLEDQEDLTNVCVVAKALVFARTGQPAYRTGVVSALRAIVNSGTYMGRALALGRELGAYVIAADLINLKGFDPALDSLFRAKLRQLRLTYTTGASPDLIRCHEERPNNWGNHCGATRAAIAAYLGETAVLARIARVFRGYLGERDSYAGFTYGETSWQCDESNPVGINPANCTKNGRPLDGVLPDDQRRSGSFVWPAAKENYVWEALQGAVVQAVILHRAGYDPFNWGNKALLRAAQWLHSVNNFPAANDDTWVPHILNYFYGSSFPAPSPTRPGKNMGWADWTHAGTAPPPPVPVVPVVPVTPTPVTVTPVAPAAASQVTTASVVIRPMIVSGGGSTTGIVTLTAPAPAGGAVVTLADDSGVVTLDPTVTVPAGATSVAFLVRTSAVSLRQQATISASYGGTVQAIVIVDPPAIMPTIRYSAF